MVLKRSGLFELEMVPPLPQIPYSPLSRVVIPCVCSQVCQLLRKSGPVLRLGVYRERIEAYHSRNSAHYEEGKKRRSTHCSLLIRRSLVKFPFPHVYTHERQLGIV